MIQMIKKLMAAVLLTALVAFHAHAEDAAPDFTQLLAFGRLANVAYLDEDAINKELKLQNFQLVKRANVPGYAVTWFLAVNETEKTQVIVVRGTDNAENAFVDVALQLMPDEKLGIKLHQGFMQSASNVYQQVLPLLHKDYQIITIGHSLGGAIANILAMYLDVDKYNVEKVVTYGQPKVTNVSGTRKYAHLDVTRVVTPKDVVPLVPPLDPVSMMNMMSLDLYWHQGKEILLLDTNEYAVLEGRKSMMRAARFMETVPDEKNVQHHMMSEYLRRLGNKAAGAKQVPYNTEFNLFGSSR